MSDQLKSSLDAIFDQHEAAKHAAVVKEQTRRSEEDLFVDEFLSVRATIIRPAFEKVAELVKARGHDCEVVDVGGHPNGVDVPADARVTFRILLKNPRGDQGQPHLSAICDKAQRRVRFHESTMTPNRGGHAGPVGEVALSAVTEEVIFSKAINLVREVFS